jgi:hypothetical protein
MLTVNKSGLVSENPGFRRMFARDRLTLGVFLPIEAFEREEPTLRDQETLVRRAEVLGFAAPDERSGASRTETESVTAAA